MKKAVLIKQFEENLRSILTQREPSALSSVPACILTLQEVLTQIPGDEVTPQEFLALKADFGVSLDRVQKVRAIRGKAAFYSKGTLARLEIHPDADRTRAVEKSADRKSLIEIYRETQAISARSERDRGLLKDKLTQEMIRGTIAYRSRKNGDLRTLPLTSSQIIPRPSTRAPIGVATRYDIVNNDSFVAAKELIDFDLNPLVINAANKFSIGGGVEQGMVAQEETLFRCSNYHRALYPHGQVVTSGQHAGRFHYTHPIAEFGSYYTPSVQVFRDAMQQYKMIQPFSVGCLAVAGYDLGKPDKLEQNLAGKQGLALLAAFKEFTKVKIEHILEVALLNGHDAVVLPALSCGAFRLRGDDSGVTATAVAEAYQEVLEQPRYQNRFKAIRFAVLGTGPVGKINFQVFNNMVKNLRQPKGPALPASPSAAAVAAVPAARPPSPLQFFAQNQRLGAEQRHQADQKQLQDHPQVSALMDIFEKDLGLFKNLPQNIILQKAKRAVRNALVEHVDGYDPADHNFIADLASTSIQENREKFLERFKECFPIALAKLKNDQPGLGGKP